MDRATLNIRGIEYLQTKKRKYQLATQTQNFIQFQDQFEASQSLNVLRYLKYVKTAKGGKRGRMINIILCSMQLVSPLCTEIVLIIAMSLTEKLSMIIKSFVALGFVIKIDDMFSENFPNEIKTTAADLRLTIGKDQNTYKKIWNRIKK